MYFILHDVEITGNVQINGKSISYTYGGYLPSVPPTPVWIFTHSNDYFDEH